MTRHNLNEHLHWLLGTSPTEHPRPAYAPPPASSIEDVSSLPQGAEHLTLNTIFEEADSNVSSSPRQGEFVRPTSPASRLKFKGGHEMARLQSGPRSSNKPRLLSEHIPVALQTPTSSSIRKPGTSLKDQYNAQWQRRPDSTLETAISAVKRHTVDTLKTPIPRGQPSHTEVTSLDLTRDELHTSSSSTVEAFGESRAIWREDSATRKYPAVKKGKKRKSDELDEDELQADISFRMSQTGFTAIETFPDEVKSPKPSKKSDSQGATRQNISSRKAIPRQSPYDHFFDDDLDSLSTVGEHSDHQKISSPKNYDARTAIKVEPDSKLVGKSKTIADSEDEDDEAEPKERLSDLKFETQGNVNPVFAAPSTSAKKQPHKFQDKKPVDLPKAVKNKPASQLSSDQPIPTSSGASPFQRDSPTKVPLEFQQPDFQQALPSCNESNIPPDNSDNSNNSAVQAFLTFQPDGTQIFLDDLYRCRRSAAEMLFNLNIEGKTPSAEMLKQPSAWTTKIDATERLLFLRKEHLGLSQSKLETKVRVISAIEKDLPHSIYAQDLSDSKDFANRLTQIELEMSLLLVQAGLPTTMYQSIHDNSQLIGPMKHNLGERSTTLVKSTQANLHVQRALTPEARPSFPSGPSTTQYVQQTQAPNMVPRSPNKDSMVNFARTQRSPLKTYTSSPAAKDVKSYFSPSKQTPERARASAQLQNTTIQGFNPTKTPSRTRESTLDYVKEDEDLFTTHMGTPFQVDVDEDEYGEDNDDVDMVEVAKEVENRNPRSHSNHDLGRRDVFAETSGNIVRSETSKPASAFSHTIPQLSQMQHAWSKDVKAALRDRFHLRGFRPNQLEAINATLAGKDAFVLMPTGGGKSLCYQLPAIVNSGKTQGVTIVISPLLSLMQDQVEHLQKLKIQALLINSEVTAEYRRLVMDCLKEQQPHKFCQLLYVTPEMISKSQVMINAFRGLYQRQKLARIVIDEAHCVSQWGHDFRPDYKLLGEVRQQFPGVPVIALTATATENVKIDVIHNLGIKDCETFSQSFNRPNLNYEVRSKTKAKEVLEGIVNTINAKYSGQSGIIYCLSRKNCESIATKLREEYNIMAHHYHAGMESGEKKEVQRKWQAGIYNVIIATIAFGMGIDKPDVRFVIHHTIPKSLEGYYQETGRAGRDGVRSGCYLYYGYQDTSALKRMIDDGEGTWEQKERQRQMLRNVIQFCENKSDCRRVQVLNYFNESFKRENCKHSCDNCNSKSSFESRDFSELATAAVSMVKRIESANVTLLHCVDVFRGSKTKKITDLHHNNISEYGVGSNIDRGDVERIFYRLLSEDALSERNVMNKSGFANQYVTIGKNSYDFAKGRRKLRLQIRVSPIGKSEYPKKASRKATDGPTSTNVSSPVQAAARRRVKQKNRRDPGLYENTYHRDDLVVDDDDGSFIETEDESEDGFGPIPVKGQTWGGSKEPLGPPITIDEKLERLNDIHRMVVEEFLENAKELSQKILIKKALKGHPFTDTILREMAVSFPQNEKEMLEIPGIDPQKVEIHGKEFLKLVREAYQSYEAMMRREEDRPQDPNHQNIIELSSDDEVDNRNALDDFGSDDSGEERSHFFKPSPDVIALNARISQLAPAIPPVPAQSHDNSTRGARSGRGKSRGGSRRNRKASGGTSKGDTSTGATKRNSTSSRNSGSSFGGGQTRRGGFRGGLGAGGIGMMPI